MQDMTNHLTKDGLHEKLNKLFETARNSETLYAKRLDAKTRNGFFSCPHGIKPRIGIYLNQTLVATISENPDDLKAVTVHDVQHVPGAGNIIRDVIAHASREDDYTDMAQGGELYAVTEFIRENWMKRLNELIRLQDEIIYRTRMLHKYEENDFAAYAAHQTVRQLLDDALILYAGQHDAFRQKVGAMSRLLDQRLRTNPSQPAEGGLTDAEA